MDSLKYGWCEISKNKGVVILVIITSLITFFIGFIQNLITPLILAFSNSAVLGIIQTISAIGMLVTSFIIGVRTIKIAYLKMLTGSLFFAGIYMALFGLRENIILICISGFLFFAMLPFANTSLDYLIRINIENSIQGRVWGLIGLISQIGYVIAYVSSGFLADYLFTPLFLEGGLFYKNIVRIIGTGAGRGVGFLIIISGLCLSASSIILYNIKSIKKLEKRGDLCIGK
jgi:MFS family permease